jgi:hypothetical protein
MSDIPDPKKHKNISIVKSIIRIIAGTSLCFGAFWVTGILLVIAEILGIAEEMV